MSRRPASLRNTVFALLAAGLIAFLKWKGWLPQTDSPHRPVPGQSGEHSVPSASADWQILDDCRLVDHRDNDGDSFEVMRQGRQWTVRLYFVDCPEKRRHQYNGDRLAEQGRYFGGLRESETVRAGEAARDFALARLSARPFTVITRGERVYDSERTYAFVRTGNGEDLGEAIITAGLARIHTKGASGPDTSAAAEKSKLLRLESEAKRARRGGWSR